MERTYPALLDLCEAIILYRDLRSLCDDLAARLRRVMPFEDLLLALHDTSSDSVQVHLLDACPRAVRRTASVAFSLQDPLVRAVWNSREPFIKSGVDDLARCPKLRELVQPHEINGYCWLPLTSPKRRIGALLFTSSQPTLYDALNPDCLAHIAKQVAAAIENALAYQELTELKKQFAQESARLHPKACTQKFGDMIAVSRGMRAALKNVEIVAPTESTVLIEGESGTGKELVARAVHELSPRRERPLVKLNCAAIPSGLLESELFGHEKGAFTGAICQKIGRFELADGGTLFLDEVGDIPLELQPKLLRVLQEREFERIGSTKTHKVDVRLVAATNRDLAQMVAEGRFRDDLYYRLNVFPILLPPLRERREAIPSLVRHFTQLFARRMGRSIERIPTATMEALVGYPWPGNVRELQNVIERAVILSHGATLEVPLSDLRPVPRQESKTGPLALTEVEREHILSVLRQTGWVLSGPSGAAAKLGLKRSTLQNKMRKLSISKPPVLVAG